MRPTAGIYSTVHEGSYVKPGSDPIHDVEYWKKGLRHSVYFTHGIRNAVDSGHTTFLELAPNPVALMQVGLTTADAGLHDAQLIPTLARKQDEVESIIVDAGAALRVRPRPGPPNAVQPRRAARRTGRLCEHPADPVQAQRALAGCALLRRRLDPAAGFPRRAAGRPPRLGVRSPHHDGSGRPGEARCEPGHSGCATDAPPSSGRCPRTVPDWSRP